MKRAIITGPTGAIGIALIQYLIDQNVKVLAICRKGSKRIKWIPKHENVEVVECNLDNLCNYSGDTNTTYDVFYHFAWEGTIGDSRNDMYLQNKNVKYTLDAVTLAERFGCHTFIGAGSQAEYGIVEGILSPSTPTNPQNGYGMAKLCAGQMSRYLCQQKSITHIWTRILSIYGPYDGENTMVISTIKKLLADQIPQFTKGEQQWDYLYSGDAAKALYLIGEKGHDKKIYCIGSGSARPLYEYIYKIRDAIDPRLNLGIGDIPYSENQVMYLCADIKDLTEDTGFKPSVDFDGGIQQTINWVRGFK